MFQSLLGILKSSPLHALPAVVEQVSIPPRYSKIELLLDISQVSIEVSIPPRYSKIWQLDDGNRRHCKGFQSLLGILKSGVKHTQNKEFRICFNPS